MAELDSATGDSSTHGSVGGKSFNKRKLAIPMIALIGIGGAVLVYIVFKMRGTGAAAATPGTIADPAASANQSASDVYGYLGGIQSLVGNLGQQMNTDFAAIQKQITDSAPTPNVPNPPTASAGTVTQYSGQFHHTFVDSLGELMHEWFTPNQGWRSEKLGTGMAVGSTPDVSIYNNQFQVVAAKAGGGFFHDWWTPGGGWAQDPMAGIPLNPPAATTPVSSNGSVTHPILSSSGPTAAA